MSAPKEPEREAYLRAIDKLIGRDRQKPDDSKIKIPELTPEAKLNVMVDELFGRQAREFYAVELSLWHMNCQRHTRLLYLDSYAYHAMKAYVEGINKQYGRTVLTMYYIEQNRPMTIADAIEVLKGMLP